jgi:hypothetical protein
MRRPSRAGNLLPTRPSPFRIETRGHGVPTLRKHLHKLVSLLSVMALAACGDGHPRGSVSKSADGKTYFAVMDDNGGKCGQVSVDGVAWPHPIGKVVLFQPGDHTISCGGEIAFTIPAGTTFKFDYWGP